ncbi:12592_t:CDS:1 [Acaulospora morrowiae]|uniref:12592_t:CDS:1 n=1 Tax=Acaulospora morrowiae TaxID=94023 RepID=A0A9N9N9F1_9GLOM|nr:12592_t:CDS:1 [Acaulospora morrowiae]
MDISRSDSYEIIFTIWALITPVLGIVNTVYQSFTKCCCYNNATTTTYAYESHVDRFGPYMGGMHIVGPDSSETHDTEPGFPCNILNLITTGISGCDDSVLAIIMSDFEFFSEAMNHEELNNASDILKTLKILVHVIRNKKHKITILVRIIKGILGCLAIPALITSFKEGLNDKAIMVRVFTFGAPILQEFGVNVLTLLMYTIMILMLSFQTTRMIAKYVHRFFLMLCIFWGLGTACLCYVYIAKLEGKIEKVFLSAIIAIRTFGPVEINCCSLDIGSAFCAVIHIWFAIQSIIWEIRELNVLEPGVPLWKY